MILQIFNVAGGTLLSSEKIGEVIGKERMAGMVKTVAPHQAVAGVILLVVGIVGLLERLGVIYTGLYLGSSFPQTLPMIATGLLLGEPILGKYAFLAKLIGALRPHAAWIGLIAIACGLGS